MDRLKYEVKKEMCDKEKICEKVCKRECDERTRKKMEEVAAENTGLVILAGIVVLLAPIVGFYDVWLKIAVRPIIDSVGISVCFGYIFSAGILFLYMGLVDVKRLCRNE